MTPAARVAAAIEILDVIFDGDPAEKAISAWGRSHRFAGSKDRAAIRDHVFQGLRCRASYGWLGGAGTGRGVMLGAMRASGSVDDIFTGEGYGPAPVSADEQGQSLDQADRATLFDMPDWMLPFFQATLGDEMDCILNLMRDRAGVFLRVNHARTNVADIQQSLMDEGIKTGPVSGVNTALQVLENERRVATCAAYLNGLVELQDPSSQQAVSSLSVDQGSTVLDYCAGGGGKSLALAARGARVFAHDIDPRRTKDIAPRALRAGVQIDVVATDSLSDLPLVDMVFCDAPCSGSGTWRRAPEAKWALTPDRLTELCTIQRDVLNRSSGFVKPGGQLVYATCSVFAQENSETVEAFLGTTDDFEIADQITIRPSAQSDGFFLCVMKRATNNQQL